MSVYDELHARQLKIYQLEKDFAELKITAERAVRLAEAYETGYRDRGDRINELYDELNLFKNPEAVYVYTPSKLVKLNLRQVMPVESHASGKQIMIYVTDDIIDNKPTVEAVVEEQRKIQI